MTSRSRSPRPSRKGSSGRERYRPQWAGRGTTRRRKRFRRTPGTTQTSPVGSHMTSELRHPAQRQLSARGSQRTKDHSMAIKAGNRGMRFVASSAVLLALLTGCSGDGSKTAPSGLPTPEAGKIAAFDLGALSKQYDLNDTVRAGGSLVTSDRAGNVYMLSWDNSDHPAIMRMTPEGVVSRYGQVSFPVDGGGMVIRSDGSIVFSTLNDSPTSTYELRVFKQDVTVPGLPISPTRNSVLPIGERPDGSLIITDGGTIWSLKDGKSTSLYQQSQDTYVSAVVD